MNRKCFAKINLSLDSLYLRNDGYHEIDTIMGRISLFDELKINKSLDNSFHYTSNLPDICSLEDNLIFKVWDILKDRVDKPGIDVKLNKKIPIAAGLAGGSTDAAEMIKGLNELWELNLSKKEMMDIGARLGADIPFFFEEKMARAKGIGEKLYPFKNRLKMKILIINDGTEISSTFVYKNMKDYGHIENTKIVNGLKAGNKKIIDGFENVMEDVIFENYPHLEKIKENLLELGANKTLVSGSGASIFAIFFDDSLYENAYKILSNQYNLVEKVELIDD